MLRNLQIIAIATLFLLLGALNNPALAYKKIKVFVLNPPELILSGVRQVAVMDFEGQYGQTFTDRLVARLLEEQRGIIDVSQGLFKGKTEGETLQDGAYTNIFEIIERGRLGQILAEQNLSNSGLVDNNQAVTIGQMAGVQAIITGSVSYTEETRDGTVEQRSKKGTTRVKARFRRVETSVKIKVLDVETGKILGSTEYQRFVEDTKYGAEIGNIFEVAAGVEQCVSSLAWDVANYLTPHFVLQEYELEKIKVEQIKKVAEEAAKKAEKLDIDEAYVLYHGIFEQDPYSHKLLYNLGILNEVVGNFATAQKFYDQALQLKSDEKNYKKAAERIEKTVEFIDVLTQLGVEILEHSFVFSDAEKQAALMDKIEIKGSDTERVPVYKVARQGEEVVARLPGGTTLTVVEAAGDFYKVALLGGKEGFVHKDSAKIK